jgi:uncharacterized protein YjiS (DUF1127 family)
VSSVALSRNPSRIIAALSAVMSLGRPFWSLIRSLRKTGKDARTLQMLPDHVLSDIGLQKMEIMSGTNGGRETWVIPHRYY